MSQEPSPTSTPFVVAFLLDETGSMQSVRDATISGFNEYIITLKNKHADALLTLTLFSTEKYAKVTNLTPLAYVTPLSYETYQPSGGTPLYDSAARLIRETEDAAKPIQPAPEVLFVIMTDGEENSSREFNRQRLFELIQGKERQGWTFVYLGANQDAWAVGESIGVRSGSAMTYSSSVPGTGQMFGMMAQATDRHLSRRKAAREQMPAAQSAPAPDNVDFFTDDDARQVGREKPKRDVI